MLIIFKNSVYKLLSALNLSDLVGLVVYAVDAVLI
jgi:hypothetical protein